MSQKADVPNAIDNHLGIVNNVMDSIMDSRLRRFLALVALGMMIGQTA